MQSTSMDEAYVAGLFNVSSNDQRQKRPLSPEENGVGRMFKKPRLEVNCDVVPPRPRPQPLTYLSPSPLTLGPSASFTQHQYAHSLYRPETKFYQTGLANWANANPAETINPSFVEACKSSTQSSYSMTSLFSYTESSTKSSPELQLQSTPPTGDSSELDVSRTVLALETARTEIDRLLAIMRS
jgi:hypothetical protein